MRPNLWLPALCLSLPACSSTMPPAVPVRIDPPPVALSTPCSTPDDLAEGASAQALSAWAVEWIKAYGCERSRRAALTEAWPR